MHRAFEPFSQETREEVLALFQALHSRQVTIEVDVEDKSQEFKCCPLGACLVLDAYIEPFLVDHHARIYPQEVIRFRTKQGGFIGPLMPTSLRIREAIEDDGRLGYDVDDTDFMLFYIAWDSGEIPVSDLPSLMGVSASEE